MVTVNASTLLAAAWLAGFLSMFSVFLFGMVNAPSKKNVEVEAHFELEVREKPVWARMAEGEPNPSLRDFRVHPEGILDATARDVPGLEHDNDKATWRVVRL